MSDSKAPKSAATLFIFVGLALVAIAFAVLILGQHLQLPAEHVGPELTLEIYHALIMKWFVFGVLVGSILMFCLIETWLWKNWHSWNQFCCEHHGRIYKRMMGGK